MGNRAPLAASLILFHICSLSGSQCGIPGQ
jgi:hypothetical protein